MNFRTDMRWPGALLLACLLSACGGGGSSSATPTTAPVVLYTIGGSATGLGGASVVLQDNGANPLSVSANGSFAFPSGLATGSSYAVSILTQPAGGLYCTLAHAAGTVASSNISDISLTCLPLMGGGVQNGPLTLAPTVSTVAQTMGTPLEFPQGITTDGINLYVLGMNSCMLSKMVIATGAVSTLVGPTESSNCSLSSADGDGLNAMLNDPVAITTDGSALYITELHGSKVRKVRPASGTLADMTQATAVVSSLTGLDNTAGATGSADGTGTTASFNYPSSITTDGSALYLTDQNSNKIRKIVPSSGTLADMTNATAVVSSLTGTANTASAVGAADGTGTASTFFRPTGITTDGSSLYVADSYNYKIRRIAPASGTLAAMDNATAVVTSLTGAASTRAIAGATDGSGSSARFYVPTGIATDGSSLYVTDAQNHKIRKITPASGSLAGMGSATAVVSSLTGAANTANYCYVPGRDGAGATATFCVPKFIAAAAEAIFVIDEQNATLRQIH